MIDVFEPGQQSVVSEDDHFTRRLITQWCNDRVDWKNSLLEFVSGNSSCAGRKFDCRAPAITLPNYEEILDLRT